MKVTINDRDYELKELTKEEAKTYIGKEVYVWNDDAKVPMKRKLLEVFEPYCVYPFCALAIEGVSTIHCIHCAPVPEEWYVNYYEPEGIFKVEKEYCSETTVDHGPKEHCKQKARELNEQKESTEHPLTYYELTQLLKCFGVEHYYCREVIPGTTCYHIVDENKALSNGYKIRYKCGEWMPATRETVWKWWGEVYGKSVYRTGLMYPLLCCWC